MNTQSPAAPPPSSGRRPRLPWAGADKGPQTFNGTPLALLMRLQMQQGSPSRRGADQRQPQHRRLPESFLARRCGWTRCRFRGSAGRVQPGWHCATPWLLTVPRDTPLFLLDLAARRICDAAVRESADIAMAAAREEDGQLRTQPVFCLLHRGCWKACCFHRGGRAKDRPLDRAAQDRDRAVRCKPATTRGPLQHNTLADLHSLETR